MKEIRSRFQGGLTEVKEFKTAMTSLEVSEITGKDHSKVLRDIDLEIGEIGTKNAESIFGLSYYIGGNNKKLKMYNLSEMGCRQMGMRWSAKDRFTINVALENQIAKPKTSLELAREQVKLLENIEVLENKIKEDAPRVSFAETIEKASDCILIREYSKLLANECIKLGERKLYSWLREKGYIVKNGTEPTQRAVQQGLFRVSERVVSTVKGDLISKTTKVTGKGQVFLLNKIKKEMMK